MKRERERKRNEKREKGKETDLLFETSKL